LLPQRRPGVVHERHMAAALGVALVSADRLAAAAQPFALILAAAGMFLGGCAGSASAAVVLAVLAKAFAIVEATAKMNFGLCKRNFDAAGRAGRGRWTFFVTAENRPCCKSAEGGSGQPVEFASMHGRVEG